MATLTKATAIATADPKYWDCPTLNTEMHLESSLGKPIRLPDSLTEKLGYTWATECEDALLRFFARTTHQQYEHVHRDNSYNHDNDLSSNIVYSIFAPVDCSDWIWCDDVFVVVEEHLGGDVRGNYGDATVYRVDQLGETGFFDVVCGWRAEPISEQYDAEDPELRRLNDRFSIGYSNWPTGDVRDALASKKPAWSDQYGCYVARLESVPFPVKLHPVEPYYCG
jgi:hypothetical protein